MLQGCHRDLNPNSEVPAAGVPRPQSADGRSPSRLQVRQPPWKAKLDLLQVPWGCPLTPICLMRFPLETANAPFPLNRGRFERPHPPAKWPGENFSLIQGGNFCGQGRSLIPENLLEICGIFGSNPGIRTKRSYPVDHRQLRRAKFLLLRCLGCDHLPHERAASLEQGNTRAR